MKRCPVCSQIFEDATDFCVDDGGALILVVDPAPAIPQTQIFSPIGGNAPAPATNQSRYLELGILATIITVGLLGMIYISSRPRSGDSSATGNSSPAQNGTLQSDEKTTDAASRNLPSVSQINEDSARALIERWRRSQIMKQFTEYRSCYSPTTEFIGIKDTTGGRSKQMNFESWMADRGKMMRNIIEVQLDIHSISVERDTAVARFTQKFRSVRYCDIGEKTLRIKNFADGPKIVFEAIADPIPCN